MSFSALPNEITLNIANLLHTADVNSLIQTNRGLQWLLTPLLYDRTLLPWDDTRLYDRSLPRHFRIAYDCTWNCKPGPIHHTILQKVLGWASVRGYERTISYLLDRGASLTSKCYRYRETPLHLVSQFGHTEVVKLFLQRSLAECTEVTTGTDHRPPLSLAAENGHQDIVTLLIPHSSSTHLVYTLTIAAEPRRIDTLKLLLPHASGTQLHEPLQHAAAYGHVDIVQLLLSHIEPENLSAAATAALENTVKRGHADVLELLLAAGCQVNIEFENLPKRTILHWLSEFACWMSLVKNQRADKIALVLLENGIDAAAVDIRGRTPLHFAARHGPHVTHRVLCSTNSLSNKDDPSGLTTVEYVHRSLLELLVRAGADINARDIDGRTPLHEAAENSDILTVTLLLDLGAVTYIVDKRGNTALDLGVGFMGRDGAAAVVCAIRDHELTMQRALEEAP